MSATGRNLAGSERHPDDFYETPAWCTRAILPHLAAPMTVLDAGSGTGAILRACGSFWIEKPGATRSLGMPGPSRGMPFLLMGVEQSEERVRQANEFEPYPDRDDLCFAHGDFFSLRGWIDDEPSFCDRRGNQNFSLVISNPPYGDAEKFVEHALKIGTEVCFLLRLNWLASKKRAAFHRAHPSDVFVLPKRPSFTDDGRTDATEYAWFVWGKGRGNQWFLLDVGAES